ncbi:hypothetical protein [Acinetobacter soli]|uniref:RiboL-PSP-HEPN domain-containing protein n=1 Tax=Acinetobacter soli TaxID=487316 RepID=A0A1P8EEC1_9GAMM|nr:hypothetical protein [Acinetobacter soli]APV34547.1 hypothetical protein BEN76_00315 [Acinetobacter soli]
MSNARIDYISRIQSIIFCLENQTQYADFMIDKPPVPVNIYHNSQAQLLRNGLAISIFCYLEDFIKARVNECINEIPSIYNHFSLIPTKELKMRLTHSTLEGINKRSATLKINSDEATLFNFIQNETKHISSTLSHNFTTSSYAFGWSKENINSTDIKIIFQDFFIKDFWGKVKLLSSHITSSLIDPETEFKNIMKNRHKAAHVANTQIPSNSLFDLAKSSFIIAFCVDYYISKSIKLIRINDLNHMSSAYNFTTDFTTFKIIKFENSKWKEYSTSNPKRCIKIGIDFDNLKNLVSSRLKNNQFLICFSKENYIKAWDIK